MPKISVILPVYNTPENYLRQAINSILYQTYKDFELIIINDASTNNAEEVILTYKDSRIKYYKNKKNLKVIKTLNKGLKLATGEYIARMDADDISFKTRFEKQVELLDSNPEIGLVSAGCYLMPARSLVMPPYTHEDMEYLLKFYANCVVHPVVMFRRSVIQEFDLKYSSGYFHVEDYKLWLDMCKCTKLCTIQEPLLLHNVWPNCVSEKNALEQYYNAKMLIFKEITKVLKGKGINLKKAFIKFIKREYLTREEFRKLFIMFDVLLEYVETNAGNYSKHYVCNDIHNQINDLLNRTYNR